MIQPESKRKVIPHCMYENIVDGIPNRESIFE
jgi:hypothetical protein